MAAVLQLKRGVTAKVAAYTPLEGELLLDTTTKELRVGDGTTPGGNIPTAGPVVSANKLTTARLIGGVSFDGTANINLPGVNSPGTQHTTGSAAKLTTTRAIALAGAVTGTANFDGSAAVSINTTLGNIDLGVL